MNNDNHTNQAANIITSCRYLTLATCQSEIPWCAPLAYVVNDDFEFVFYSAVSSRHCRDFEANNIVACSIFDSRATSDEVDGVQFSATIREIGVPELNKTMKHYFEESFPDPNVRERWLRPIEDFCGNSPQRFYAIKPLELFKLDLSSTKVDKRVQVDIAALRNAIR